MTPGKIMTGAIWGFRMATSRNIDLPRKDSAAKGRALRTHPFEFFPACKIALLGDSNIAGFLSSLCFLIW